jgi:serine/threonine-protein kinase PknK
VKSPALAPGLLVAQRYRLVAPLGRGSQSTVWEALDQRRDGAVCALKFSARADARTELEALARVEHPALAKVLDVGPYDSGLFVALERVVGQPLDKLVGAPAIIRAVFSVAEALSAIHDGGLVHGDVKPANILANAERAWLVDLGLAARDAKPGALVAGSLAFMAPEVLAGERSAAADLYALGVSAAWALCRTHPLVDDPHDRSALLDALARQHPVRTLLRDKLPEPCRDAILGLLDAQPSARGTARTLLARLARDAGAWLSPAQRARAASADLARRSVAPLVGRGAELERGREALARALLDHSSLGVVVAGPDGSGRARLAAEILRATKVVFAARGALCDVVDELCVEPERPTIVRLIDAPPARVRSALASLARLRRYATLKQPVAILATTNTLTEGDEPPIADVELVSLGPVPRDALRALLVAISGRSPTDAALAALVERSDALPGRFARIVAALDPAEAATATVADVSAAQARLGDPSSLVSSLDAGAVEAFERLLVAGASLSLSALASDPDRARRAFGALSRMGLAHAVAGSSRVALSAGGDDRSIDPARRRALAAQLARWLDDNGADEPLVRARIAWILGDNERAFSLANRVGLDRARPAIERVAMLSLALKIAPADRRVGLALGRLHTWLGESSLAEAALSSLGEDSEVLLARIDALRSRGAVEAARALLAVLGAKFDESSRVAAAALRAREGLEAGRVDEARVAIDSHAPTGDCNPVIALRWTEVRAYLALVEGQHERAQRLLSEVEPVLAALDDDRVRARFASLDGMALQARGAHYEARERYARAWSLAQSSGDARAAATYAVNLGTAEWLVGSLGDARSWLERGVRALAAFGTAFELARALANLAMLESFVGDRGRAIDLATRAERATAESRDPVASLGASIVHAECTSSGAALAEALGSLAEREAREGRDESARDTYARAALAAAMAHEPDVRAECLAKMQGSTAALAAVAALADCVESGAPARAALDHARAAVAADPSPEHELALLAWTARAHALGPSVVSEARSSLEAKVDALARTLSTESAALFRDAQRALSRWGPSEPSSEPAQRASSVRWKRLAEIARELNSEQRLRPLLERIMDAIVELTGATRGFLLLAGPDGTLRVRSARNLGRRDLGEDEGSPSRSIAERVARTGEAIVTIDAASDGALSTFESVTAMQLRSVLAVPLMIKGVSCGTVYVDDRFRAGAFGDGALEVAREFAEAAALAIHNARSAARLRRALRKSERLARALSKRVESQSVELEATRRALVTEHEPRGKYEAIIGRGAAMRKTLSLCDRVAATSVPVLLLGESGTGKELIARAIHQNSPRAKKPFVAVNCAAITETLLEAELFGHLRGAFTGADRARQGLFEVADSGTLFLDEVGEMSPGMQAKLLRVLQDGEVRPIGGTLSRKVDVRVIAATLRDLPKLVEKGAFREDLYYRLAVLTVQTPALRERREDIPTLIQFFLNKHGRADVKVDRRALARMVDYPWPGNVRQLENEVLRAALLCDGVLRESDLDPKLLARELDPDAPVRSPLDLRGAVEDLERKLVERALRECRGNQTKASKVLGLSRFGLQKMLKRLKLEDAARAARD